MFLFSKGIAIVQEEQFNSHIEEHTEPLDFLVSRILFKVPLLAPLSKDTVLIRTSNYREVELSSLSNSILQKIESAPKQLKNLASDLNCDLKAVIYHCTVLNKLGFLKPDPRTLATNSSSIKKVYGVCSTIVACLTLTNTSLLSGIESRLFDFLNQSNRIPFSTNTLVVEPEQLSEQVKKAQSQGIEFIAVVDKSSDPILQNKVSILNPLELYPDNNGAVRTISPSNSYTEFATEYLANESRVLNPIESKKTRLFSSSSFHSLTKEKLLVGNLDQNRSASKILQDLELESYKNNLVLIGTNSTEVARSSEVVSSLLAFAYFDKGLINPVSKLQLTVATSILGLGLFFFFFRSRNSKLFLILLLSTSGTLAILAANYFLLGVGYWLGVLPLISSALTSALIGFYTKDQSQATLYFDKQVRLPNNLGFLNLLSYAVEESIYSQRHSCLSIIEISNYELLEVSGAKDLSKLIRIIADQVEKVAPEGYYIGRISKNRVGLFFSCDSLQLINKTKLELSQLTTNLTFPNTGSIRPSLKCGSATISGDTVSSHVELLAFASASSQVL